MPYDAEEEEEEEEGEGEEEAAAFVESPAVTSVKGSDVCTASGPLSGVLWTWLWRRISRRRRSSSTTLHTSTRSVSERPTHDEDDEDGVA